MGSSNKGRDPRTPQTRLGSPPDPQPGMCTGCEVVNPSIISHLHFKDPKVTPGWFSGRLSAAPHSKAAVGRFLMRGVKAIRKPPHRCEHGNRFVPTRYSTIRRGPHALWAKGTSFLVKWTAKFFLDFLVCLAKI